MSFKLKLNSRRTSFKCQSYIVTPVLYYLRTQLLDEVQNNFTNKFKWTFEIVLLVYLLHLLTECLMWTWKAVMLSTVTDYAKSFMALDMKCKKSHNADQIIKIIFWKFSLLPFNTYSAWFLSALPLHKSTCQNSKWRGSSFSLWLLSLREPPLLSVLSLDRIIHQTPMWQ